MAPVRLAFSASQASLSSIGGGFGAPDQAGSLETRLPATAAVRVPGMPVSHTGPGPAGRSPASAAVTLAVTVTQAVELLW